MKFNYPEFPLNDSLEELTIFSDSKNIEKYKLDLLPISEDDIIYDERLVEIDSLGFNEFNMLGVKDCSVLICDDNNENTFVTHCERMGFRYGLILKGHESLINYMGYIASPNCIFVIRNYFNPISYDMAKSCGAASKILHIRGSVNDIFYDLSKRKKGYTKDINWFFGGDYKTGRVEALKAFIKIPDGKYVLTKQGFLEDSMKTDALKTPEYFEIMSRARFVPCPVGWVNIDTVRVYEALDAGSIPVMIHNLSNLDKDPNYWKYIFNNNEIPCILSNKWDFAVEKCLSIIDSGDYDKLNDKYSNYWKNLNTNWRLQILSFFHLLKEQKYIKPTNTFYPIALSNQKKI